MGGGPDWPVGREVQAAAWASDGVSRLRRATYRPPELLPGSRGEELAYTQETRDPERGSPSVSECAADGDDRLQRPAPMSGMSESSAAEPPAQPGRRDGERPRGEERPRGVVPRAAAARRSLCPSDRPRLGTLKIGHAGRSGAASGSSRAGAERRLLPGGAGWIGQPAPSRGGGGRGFELHREQPDFVRAQPRRTCGHPSVALYHGVASCGTLSSGAVLPPPLIPRESKIARPRE